MSMQIMINGTNRDTESFISSGPALLFEVKASDGRRVLFGFDEDSGMVSVDGVQEGGYHDFVGSFTLRKKETNEAIARALQVISGEVPAPPRKEVPVVDEVWCVVLSGTENKIATIKELRAIAPLSLKEAKDLVDQAPKTVLWGLSEKTARDAVNRLAIAGGHVQAVLQGSQGETRW